MFSTYSNACKLPAKSFLTLAYLNFISKNDSNKCQACTSTCCIIFA